MEKALPHCRSVSLHPDGNRLAVTQVILQTGALTGNVKSDKPGGAYPGSKSVIHLFETVPSAAT